MQDSWLLDWHLDGLILVFLRWLLSLRSLRVQQWLKWSLQTCHYNTIFHLGNRFIFVGSPVKPYAQFLLLFLAFKFFDRPSDLVRVLDQLLFKKRNRITLTIPHSRCCRDLRLSAFRVFSGVLWYVCDNLLKLIHLGRLDSIQAHPFTFLQVPQILAPRLLVVFFELEFFCFAFNRPLFEDDFFKLGSLLRAHFLELSLVNLRDVHFFLNSLLSKSYLLAHLEHFLVSLKHNVTQKPTR